MSEPNEQHHEQYVYPYHYATRKLTKSELLSIRDDLVKAAKYTEIYNDVFVHPDVAWNRELDLRYNDIQKTITKIIDRGNSTEHYTALEKTPLLVADIYVYLWEIIDFMRYRSAPTCIYRVDKATFPNWTHDVEDLISMEKEVRNLLASIAPPEVVLHAVLAHAIHKATT